MDNEKLISGKIYELSSSCACKDAPDLDPCTIVIFGASGDLATRKLIPALYQMFTACSLPTAVSIVGCSRTEYSDQEFREKQKEWLKEANADLGCWPEFAAKLFYKSISYEDASFQSLADYLIQLDDKQGTKGNRIYDLAVPPHLYAIIGSLLGKAGLARQNMSGNGWSRIVVEKPFGRDFETSRKLNQVLQEYFNESQIFRIDHYLAKETVQNVLAFRFANSIFEPLWNRHHIAYVGIIAAEQLGVEHRAGYYEQSGVLRDMFQNHLMQLLALTAMEPPSNFEADLVRDEKIKVFQSLRPLDKAPNNNVILGQYSAGMIDNQKTTGYRDEPGVARDSVTPTFAMLNLFIDNWRWQGVPFYLASGKRLSQKMTKIIIQFKEVPHSMFRNVIGDTITGNRLEFGIHPNELIGLTFQTKQPGAQVNLQRMMMDFQYQENYSGSRLAAYEKVLLDCINGDHMFFWRQDGVELAWKFLEPILHEGKQVSARSDHLNFYPAGSWGPEDALEKLHLILTGAK
jgi:glucose-6-phosphate 1-dehydrogenase